MSCVLPLAPSMSFRSGEGAGEENALSRSLRALDFGMGQPIDVSLLIVGAGLAGAAASEAVRTLGVDARCVDSRIDRGGPRPVMVQSGRLLVADEGVLRPVNARAVVLATGARRGEPQLAIAKALGCRTTFDRGLGYERLVLDSEGGTSIPGIFAAGDAARVGSEREAVASGRRAGEAAAARLGKRS